MKRREFMTLLGGAATWPLAARAQQQANMPVIGWLNGTGPPQLARVEAVRHGLGEIGYVEGRNVIIETHWSVGNYDRMLEMAAELARRPHAALIVTGGGAPAVVANMVVASIPVVFATGADPIKAGLVTSLHRPGGNATGVYFFTAAIEAKRIGILRDLVPSAGTIGVLLNPAYPDTAAQSREIEEAARNLGLRTVTRRATTEAEIGTAFAAFEPSRVGALLVAADPYFNSQRQQIVLLAARQAIPAIYEGREYAVAGGLMSYGTNIVDAYRQIGIYAGRILKGERAGDLPVVQPTKFEFLMNLKTAKALGLTVSPGLLAIADEVIE